MTTDLNAEFETAARAGSNGVRPNAEPRPFARVPLGQLARDGIPAPTFLADGYLYRGQLHSLAGPPDAGKTVLLLHWMRQAIRAGYPVLLLDEEAGREGTVEKYLALGGTPEEIDQLHYFEFPGRAWDAADIAGLYDYVDEVRPAIIGFDSMAAFMARAGLEENDAKDVTKLVNDVLLPLARYHGAAVTVIDHLTKADNGGRYARGSGAKLAAVDVAYLVDLIKPFSRHESGLLKLAAKKDRRGYLHREHSVQVKTSDGLELLFEQTHGAKDNPRQLGPASVKILEALADASIAAAGTLEPGQLDNRQIVDKIVERHGHGLGRQTVSEKLNEMLDDGLVEVLDGGKVGSARQWWITPEGQAALPAEDARR